MGHLRLGVLLHALLLLPATCLRIGEPDEIGEALPNMNMANQILGLQPDRYVTSMLLEVTPKQLPVDGNELPPDVTVATRLAQAQQAPPKAIPPPGPAPPPALPPPAPPPTPPPVPAEKSALAPPRAIKRASHAALIVVVSAIGIAFLYYCCKRSASDEARSTLGSTSSSDPLTVPEDDDLDWPKTLIVTSSHGHAGNYHIVPGRRPNGYPLWKNEASNDWIFCSTSNQWLIGDESEEAVNFECETGNIASYEVHAGRMPDEIGPGGWLYFDGKGWQNFADINITSDSFTLADQEATQERQHASASKIQASYKGRRDRKKVEALREQKNEDARRNAAAARISAMFRGQQERKQLAEEARRGLAKD